MIAIEIDFPAGGRWHATAWGTHVNEGVPEWPPCPWRLCRALIASWHWKHRREEDVLVSLLEKLASEPPSYHLPDASAAHTRHYMPVIVGKNETKTKIFDTFVHVSADQSLWIRWNVTLSPQERDLLGTLLQSLSYMGRAESLVSARLADTGVPDRIAERSDWTVPADSSDADQSSDGEPIRLLAPRLAGDYADWLREQVSQNDPARGKGKTKKTAIPTTLVDAMRLDTADWKKDGWSLPPGSRWIEYVRPRDCFKIAPIGRSSRRASKSRPPTVARFAIVGKVPPGITQALSLAERFRQGILAYVKTDASPAFTGRDEHGAPLTTNEHVYFLPECDQQGYVTHMTLYAPRGFSEADSLALSRLQKVWAMEGKGFEIQVVLLATGQTEDFNLSSPYFRPARIWTSLTPFVPVHHPKSTRTGVPKIDPDNGLQIGSPEHDCRRLLELIAKEKKVVSVTRPENNGARIRIGSREIPCLKFQLQRRTGTGHRSDNRGYALQIEFEKAETLPIGLGYAAHFGLGLFLPQSDQI